MHRFYADGLGEIGSLVTLSEEDARHASRVLRMQPGDAAELFLDGRRFSAEIAEMTAEGVTARWKRRTRGSCSACAPAWPWCSSISTCGRI